MFTKTASIIFGFIAITLLTPFFVSAESVFYPLPQYSNIEPQNQDGTVISSDRIGLDLNNTQSAIEFCDSLGYTLLSTEISITNDDITFYNQANGEWQSTNSNNVIAYDEIVCDDGISTALDIDESLALLNDKIEYQNTTIDTQAQGFANFIGLFYWLAQLALFSAAFYIFYKIIWTFF